MQKDKNVSPRDEHLVTAADETVPEEMEARKIAVRLHQTCGPVPADHEARSRVKRRQLQETKGDAKASLKERRDLAEFYNREDAHVQERDKSRQHT